MSASAESSPSCPFGHGAEAPAGHHGYEPFEMKDPFPAYRELRAEQPVMYDERINYYVVTRYDDIKAVFDDWETFSSANAQAPVRERGEAAKKIMADGGFTAYSGLSARTPPEHTRIRAIVQRAFTPRLYKSLEPAIRQNAVTRIEKMLTRPDHTGDMVRDLAYDIPTITILTLVGADISQIDTYKRWADSRGAMTWGDLSDEEQIPHAHNLVEYWQECLRMVRMAHEGGAVNLTADLVKAQVDGAEISDHEIASIVYSLLFAGHETTTTLISNCIRVLLAHRDQWNQLVEDPKKIPAAVDEVLRYSGSIVGWRRTATKDAKIGGVDIPRGAGILLLMGSANRDESRFDDGESFDISRPNAREHLSFGFGIHYCLGNALAKLQAKIALEEITRLAPSLQLVEPENITFRENLSFRTPEAVLVKWEA
jgi:cytochrome P450